MKLNSIFGLSVIICLFGLQSCGGSGSKPPSRCSIGQQANVTISGKATFDRVPLFSTGSLDFANTSRDPVKGVTVEAVCNTAIATAITDENGDYSLSIPGGTKGVFIRVKAQMLKAGSPSWDVAVIDESQQTELVFAMVGAQFTSAADEVRNLHAASGWGGSSYTTTRVAAPFAILDTIYDAMQLVLSVEPTAQFPELDVQWSAKSVDGTYFTNTGNVLISVLGRTTDTDEFDEHVIAHEWGHYFQYAFSRDESIGGPHSGGDILDIRVAFSEGFGNAFSAMVTGVSTYKDSQGLLPSTGNLTFDVEGNSCTNPGWYSECSVQSVLYDFFDTNIDHASDVFALGFQPIFEVMTIDLPNTEALSSLFSFITPFKNQANGADIDNLLAGQSMTESITDDIGSNITINPPVNIVDHTPVFSAFPITPSLCTTGQYGGYNGLGVTRFIQFTAPSSDSFKFVATRVSGLTTTDPDMVLRSKGQLIAFAETYTNNSETLIANLVMNTVYVLEIAEYATFGNPDYTGSAEACFSVTRAVN